MARVADNRSQGQGVPFSESVMKFFSSISHEICVELRVQFEEKCTIIGTILGKLLGNLA